MLASERLALTARQAREKKEQFSEAASQDLMREVHELTQSMQSTEQKLRQKFKSEPQKQLGMSESSANVYDTESKTDGSAHQRQRTSLEKSNIASDMKFENRESTKVDSLDHHGSIGRDFWTTNEKPHFQKVMESGSPFRGSLPNQQDPASNSRERGKKLIEDFESLSFSKAKDDQNEQKEFLTKQNSASKRYGKQRYKLSEFDTTEYNTPVETQIQLVDENKAEVCDKISERPSLYVRVIRPYLNEEVILQSRYRSKDPNYQSPTKMTVKSSSKSPVKEQSIPFEPFTEGFDLTVHNSSDKKPDGSHGSVARGSEAVQPVRKQPPTEAKLFFSLQETQPRPSKPPAEKTQNIDRGEPQSQPPRGTAASDGKSGSEKPEELRKKLFHPLYISEPEAESDVLNHPYLGLDTGEEKDQSEFYESNRLSSQHGSNPRPTFLSPYTSEEDEEQQRLGLLSASASTGNRHLKTITEEDSDRRLSHAFESNAHAAKNSDIIQISDPEASRDQEEKEPAQPSDRGSSVQFEAKEQDPSFLSLDGPISSLKFPRSISKLDPVCRAYYEYETKVHGLLMASQYFQQSEIETVLELSSPIEAFSVLDDDFVCYSAGKVHDKSHPEAAKALPHAPVRLKCLYGGRLCLVESETNDFVVFDEAREELFRFNLRPQADRLAESAGSSSEEELEAASEEESLLGSLTTSFSTECMNIAWTNPGASLFLINTLAGTVSEYPGFWASSAGRVRPCFLVTSSDELKMAGIGAAPHEERRFSFHFLPDACATRSVSKQIPEAWFEEISGLEVTMDSKQLVVAGRAKPQREKAKGSMPCLRLASFDAGFEERSRLDLDVWVGDELVDDEGPVVSLQRMKKNDVYFVAFARSVQVVCLEKERLQLVRKVAVHQEGARIASIAFDGLSLYFSTAGDASLRRIRFENLKKAFFGEQFRSPAPQELVSKCKEFASFSTQFSDGRRLSCSAAKLDGGEPRRRSALLQRPPGRAAVSAQKRRLPRPRAAAGAHW